MFVKAAIAAAVIMSAIAYVIIPVVLDVFPNLVIPVSSNLQIALYSMVAFLFVL
jgi:hypothetical protein